MAILLGCLCMAVGLMMGGSLNALRVSLDFDEKGLMFSQHDMKDKIDLSLGNITSLQIEMSMGDVTFVEADEEEVRALNVIEDQYTLDIRGSQAILELKEKKGFSFFNFGNNHTQNVKIVVPRGFIFERLEIHNSMGDVNLMDTSAKYLSVEANMGDIEGNNLRTEDMSIENDMGDIKLEGIFLKNSEIHNAMGDITIHVLDKIENYSYQTKCNLGDVRVNREEGRNSQVSNTPNELIISNSLGDISLNFK